MAKDRNVFTFDGESWSQGDFLTLAGEGALADDSVLQELLRLAPYSGSAVAKCIVPHRIAGSNGALVQPAGGTGSVRVMPFRAVTGTATAISSTAGTADLNWQDIRSRIFDTSSDNATIGALQPFGANSSGQPRWDLLYAQFQRDANNPNVTRNTRAPGTSQTAAPVPKSVVPSLTQIVSLGVVPGTTAVTPTIPPLPADGLSANGPFYFPLAAILIPPGFTPTSIITTPQIFMQAPLVELSSIWSGRTSRPASAIAEGLQTSLVNAWGASGAGTIVRPPEALPCTMRGTVRRIFPLFANTPTPTIGDAGVVDLTIDWRKRKVSVRAECDPGAAQFAWQPGASAGAFPQPSAQLTRYETAGQAFYDNTTAVFGGMPRNGGVVFYANSSLWSAIGPGAAIGLYVDLASGNLKLFYQGTPGGCMFFTIEAEDCFDNA